MKRIIIETDEAKCDGCGLCAEACHEGAIEIVNGTKLMREDFCNGFGACLPSCPASHFEKAKLLIVAYSWPKPMTLCMIAGRRLSDARGWKISTTARNLPKL